MTGETIHWESHECGFYPFSVNLNIAGEWFYYPKEIYEWVILQAIRGREKIVWEVIGNIYENPELTKEAK